MCRRVQRERARQGFHHGARQRAESRMARQRLGQHFLADPGWREEIARAIRISPHSIAATSPADAKSSCWLEIGAGHGEMTEHLASAGAPVYAIELDAQFASRLSRLARRYPNLAIVAGDILRIDIAQIAAGRKLRIYGNLPYYITSPILQRLFALAEHIEEIHVVIQLEVARRLIALPGTRDYGYLSVLTQYFARPELVLEIPRSAFSPPPEVGSALVTLRFPGERAKLPQLDQERFLDFVKLCFSQKRKTLVNNLKMRWKPEAVREALGALQLRADVRAEQLSLAPLAALFENLSQRAGVAP
jgi:16S rRNA (adenine1518-N6/adenine1519-N6)-dimethyltransferase